MDYYVVDAFTDRPFGGNQAGVVLLQDDVFPADRLMLQVAAELRYSETAFVRRHSACEFTLRYFTPVAEVELCGHATIATFSLLHQKGLCESRCLCHTMAGDLEIETGRKVMMQMATPHIVDTINDTDEVYAALGLPGYRPAMPVQSAYAGLVDLMVPIADVDTLSALQPDMEAIAGITRRLDLVSFHLFAFGKDGYTAHVRDFAPLYGVSEESATGTANASLTHYLHQQGCLTSDSECAFIQGESMGRPSVVTTRLSDGGKKIFVGGTATIVAEGHLLVG